ncbi:MAG: PTS sugar transporter subunit IIA [Elusimicrobiales bacterium]
MAKQPAPRFNLASILSPERILILESGLSKNTVIERLSPLVAAQLPDISPEQLLGKIMQREAGISTTLDTGLCIPHARLEIARDFLGALALIPGGIAEPVHGGVTIKAVFLFVSPSDGAFFQKHLRLLAALSSAFQPVFIDKISSLSSPEEIFAAVSAK